MYVSINVCLSAGGVCMHNGVYCLTTVLNSNWALEMGLLKHLIVRKAEINIFGNIQLPQITHAMAYQMMLTVCVSP